MDEGSLSRAQFRLIIKMKQWLPRGLCRQYSGTDFTKDRPRNAHVAKIAEQDAKAVCEQCPVQVECLDHACSFPEPVGIWGGLNPEERKRYVHDNELNSN